MDANHQRSFQPFAILYTTICTIIDVWWFGSLVTAVCWVTLLTCFTCCAVSIYSCVDCLHVAQNRLSRLKQFESAAFSHPEILENACTLAQAAAGARAIHSRGAIGLAEFVPSEEIDGHG
jgi:hypothetical protein